MPEQSLSLAVALAGGLLYFLSPCVWPLYPAYVGYLAGGAAGTAPRAGPAPRRAVLLRALGFVLGFSLIFVALGATASALGQVLLAYQPILRRVAGVLIILFGLLMLGWLRLPALAVERRPLTLTPRPGFGGSLVMGLAFGFGWTPCVGPVLAGILALASASATVGHGVALLASFALGLAVPFLLVALLFDRVKHRWSDWSRRLRLVEPVAGGLLVVLGVLIYTNYFAAIAAWLFYTVT